MEVGFNISRKLGDGKLLHVAWRAKIRDAEELVRNLTAFWPADYVIQDAKGDLSQFHAPRTNK
jgi:hypothetical protein